MRRVQFAGAFTLAHVDGGWRGSRRRAALLALAQGPMDWTVEAGLVALGALSREIFECRDETMELCRRRLETLPSGGHVCYLLALSVAVRFLIEEADKDLLRECEGIFEELTSVTEEV